MATESGVWGLQQVRDKQLQSEWSYNATGDAGSLWSFGYNNGGDLGQNDRTKYSSPVQIPGTWKGIGGVKSDGTLWSWGYNGAGQLGQNTQGDSRSSPVQIPGTTWKSAYGLIDNGNTDEPVFAIKTDGTLWSWGWNTSGQLGVNNRTTYSSPTQVGTDTTWLTPGYNKFGYSHGYDAMAAIKTDGTLWMCGRKDYGVLAQNNTTYYSSPVQVPGTTWKSVSRGLSVAFQATKTDGTLWTWGRNEFGQLGLNNKTVYSSPMQIPGTTWDIAGGGVYTGSATRTDGTLWIWGYGNNGGLGLDSGNTAYSSPSQLPGTTWSRPLPMGTYANGALRTDGTLWVWGEGAGGILGQNSAADSNSPVQIPGAWIELRGAGSVTEAIREL